MRVIAVPIVALVALAFAAGCAGKPKIKTETPKAAVAPEANGGPNGEAPLAKGDGVHAVPDPRTDPVPRVIRRLVAEQREDVGRILTLASALGDARGRERATSEGKELEVEVAKIEALLVKTDSDSLDEVATNLRRLDTKIALLLEKLRTANDKTTAVLVV
jgi:hypothetical protein